MKHTVFHLSTAALAAALLSACATAPGDSAAGSQVAPDTVHIARTTHGIPHVTAANLEMLAYGIAYAHAQDNVCLSLDVLATVRGQRTQYFGAAASGVLGVRTLPNPVIDTFVQAHMDDAKLAATWDKASPDGKSMARGYVAGFNRYLQDHAGKLPQECNGKPWVQAMTLADYYRATEAIQVQAGAGALADAIAGARPPAAQSGRSPEVHHQSDVAARMQGAYEHLREAGIVDSPLGSNAWAFGKASTQNGRGMLLGNPHYPWVGPSRFYQMHLRIPGQLDVMGAALGWSPVVQIGFNKDIAWSHTVSTGKRFTLHELALAPGKPTHYLIDGQEEAMQARKVTVGGREGTVWVSRYGPVLVIPRAGLNWTAERAYAIQDANAGSVRSNDMYLQFARARSVGDMRSALNALGTPFVNTIVADRHGDAMYADVSGVPDLDAADLQRCAPSPAAAALLRSPAGLVVLNGSKSDCNWKRDAASPAPGLIAPGRMPVVVRQDWVHNSNDSFFYTHPDQRWSDVPVLVGDDVVRRPRTRSEFIEIPELLGRGKVSLSAMQAQLFENRNLMARMVLPDLLAACGQAPSEEAKAGCAALKTFHDSGMKNDADAKGAPLFREFWRGASAIPNVYREPFDKARPVATPSGLRLQDATVQTQVWNALAGAVKKMRSAGFAPDAPLGQVQQAVFADEPITLHGGDEIEGVLNNVGDRAAPGISAKGIRIDYGTSYVQTVGFDDRGPVAQALLVYGQSTQAGSPHRADQLKAFAAKRWPGLPFHVSDIERERIAPDLVLSKP